VSRFEPRHPWNVPPEEARALQRQMAAEVVEEDRLGEVRSVAGVDCGFPRRDGEEQARAAVVLLSFPELEPLGDSLVEEPVRYPYIPGLLSFREAPPIIAALEHLPMLPDLILVDGQGRAHPRRFGIACHLGLLLDRPTIGCAKSLLVGQYALPDDTVGAWSPLLDRGQTIGAVVRTRAGVKPIFVSVGHRVSLQTAVALTLACGRGTRLPEPTRLADQLASSRTTAARSRRPASAAQPDQLGLFEHPEG
jgi:deoxyribonuclease V